MDMKAEEQLIKEHLEYLEKLRQGCYIVLPDAYNDTIAAHWFENIGPAKTEEYGVTAWQRLGARGITAQLSGCYYRWVRLVSKGYWLDQPPMFNAVVDAFGYSMLLHACLGVHPIYNSDKVLPRVDHELILDRLWWPPNDSQLATGAMGTVSLRMAYQMWKGASGG